MNDILSLKSPLPAGPAGGASAGIGSAQPKDDSFKQILDEQRPPAEHADATLPGEEAKPAPANGRGKPEKQKADREEAALADAVAEGPETLLAQQTLEIAVQVAAQLLGQRPVTAESGRQPAEAGKQGVQSRVDSRVDPRALALDKIAATPHADLAIQPGKAPAAALLPGLPTLPSEPATDIPVLAASVVATQSSDPRIQLRDTPLRVSQGTLAQPLVNPRADAGDSRWRVTGQPALAASAQTKSVGQTPVQDVLSASLFASIAQAEERRADVRAELNEIAPSVVHASLAPSASQGGVSAPMVAHIAPPVGSAAWAPELGRQVVRMGQSADGTQQTAELRLDPPDLGPLRITLSIQDGVAHAVFASAHSAVRTAVEAALPSLERSLAEAGISLGQANVNDQDRPEQETGGFASNGRGNGGGEAGLTDAGDAVATAHRPDPRSLVDTFA